jgi:flavin-binding protein dodecin
VERVVPCRAVALAKAAQRRSQAYVAALRLDLAPSAIDLASSFATANLRLEKPIHLSYRVFIVFAACATDNPRMAEHVYKKIEIVGSSPNGMEEAVHNALSRASKTIRNMRWFEVTETRGYIDDGKIEHWQVTLKIGFTLEE